MSYARLYADADIPPLRRPANDEKGIRPARTPRDEWAAANAVTDAYLRRLGVTDPVVRLALRAEVQAGLAGKLQELVSANQAVQAAQEVVDIVDRRLAATFGLEREPSARDLASARAAYLWANGPKRFPHYLLKTHGDTDTAARRRTCPLPPATPEEKPSDMPTQQLNTVHPRFPVTRWLLRLAGGRRHKLVRQPAKS